MNLGSYVCDSGRVSLWAFVLATVGTGRGPSPWAGSQRSRGWDRSSPGGMVSDSLQPIALIGGIVLWFVGMICGAVGSQVLVPRRIDKHFVWLSKVSPDYLAAFPDWSA